MYVDGANHRLLVEEVQVSQRFRDAKPTVVPGHEAKPDPLYLPAMSHPAHILRDTFERIQAARAAEATYKDKEDPVRHYDHVASVIDELRGTLDKDYHDAIARLESDIETNGEPPISDRHDDVVVYRSFIDAYERGSVSHGVAPDSGVHDLLDTAG